MKRLLTIAIASIFAIGAHAQNAPATNSNTTPPKATVAAPATATNAHQAKMKDGVMMKDGKMWVTQDGKTTAMDKEVTMKNGTKVMTDGTYVTKDGKKMKLANGVSIDKEGNLEHAKPADSKATGTQPKK